MASHLVRAKLIGDGKSFATAFRPDLPEAKGLYMTRLSVEDGVVTMIVEKGPPNIEELLDAHPGVLSKERV